MVFSYFPLIADRHRQSWLNALDWALSETCPAQIHKKWPGITGR
jgi:hypothetical protein